MRVRLKWQFDVCRKKLEAAVGEVKEVRRVAKDALSLKAEVARLEKLLAEAGVEPCKRSSLVSLRMEAARLRKALEGRKETIHALRTERGGLLKELGLREKKVARLEERLAREAQASEIRKETIRCLDEEVIRLYKKLRRLRDQAEWSSRCPRRSTV